MHWAFTCRGLSSIHYNMSDINTAISVFKPLLSFQIKTQNKTLSFSVPFFLGRECWGLTDQPCMSTNGQHALKVKGLVLHRSPNLQHSDNMNCIMRSAWSWQCLSVSLSSLPSSLRAAAIMQNSQENTAKCDLMDLSFKLRILRIGHVTDNNISWTPRLFFSNTL